MKAHSYFHYLEYEKRCSQHTLTAYRNDLKQFTDYLMTYYELDDPTEARPQHIRSWMAHLMEQGTAIPSINRKLSCLRSFYRFLIRSGKLKHHPMNAIALPRAPKRLPEFVPGDQMEKLFSAVDADSGFRGLRNRLILEMLYATGMRRAELIALTDQDIDWNRHTVHVLGKGNKERLIPFGHQLKALLQQYLEVRNHHFNRHDFPVLLVSDRGKQMNPRSVYRLVHRMFQQISFVSRRSPHVLRHSFATHLLNNGAEIQAIRELLGHASLAATQVYAHNTVEQLKAVYRKAHPKA